MFVPTARKFAAVVAGVLMVMGVLTACSSTSTPSTPSYTTEAYEIPEHLRLDRSDDTTSVPDNFREWTTPEGKHCWESDADDGSLYGSPIDHVRGPAKPDAPVLPMNEFVDKAIEMTTTCRGEGAIHGSEYSWVDKNICQNYPSGDLYLRDYLYGLRYFDGTEFSAISCPPNPQDANRIVVPRAPR